MYFQPEGPKDTSPGQARLASAALGIGPKTMSVP